MILFFFTLIDLVVLVTTILGHFNVFGSMLPLALAAGYMFFKGLIFWGNIPSFIDLLVGVYLVLMILGVRWKLTALVVVWLANKIIVAFLG